jgi:hypothetical protein
MNPQKLRTETNRQIDNYIAMLDKYSMEQLLQKPTESSWSIGQVYVHLWMAAKGFFFKNAAACLSKENTQIGHKNWIGRLVFLFKQMPTIKVKMPTKVAVEPRQPESKQQLIDKLNEIKALSEEYINQIAQSDSNQKTKHPFLGYLNCGEWVSLCAMHYKHHLKQIKRIQKAIGV